jgi:phosphoglycerate dehydrogenase-like enzyme
MSLSSAAPASPSSPTRIVAALTRRERRLFFGESSAVELSRWHWLSDDEIVAPGWTDRIANLRPAVLVTGWSTPLLPEDWLRAADCPLRMVCHVTGSVRRLVPRAFLERGGVVTNWGDTVGAQVAEHALLLALAALRNTARWPDFIARPVETRRIEQLETKTLFQRRVGLHGFGGVARALVPLLRPFGVEIAAYSAGVPPEMMHSLGVTPVASLDELFAGRDVLFECEALTAASERSVTAEVLARLPDDAVFVNIGRGGVVDEPALLREAGSGRVRVALDVVEIEPLTAASLFTHLSGVMLSPHIGGPTTDRYRSCGAFALANLSAFLRGEPPPAAISLAGYDRAT